MERKFLTVRYKGKPKSELYEMVRGVSQAPIFKVVSIVHSNSREKQILGMKGHNRVGVTVRCRLKTFL